MRILNSIIMSAAILGLPAFADGNHDHDDHEHESEAEIYLINSLNAPDLRNFVLNYGGLVLDLTNTEQNEVVARLQMEGFEFQSHLVVCDPNTQVNCKGILLSAQFDNVSELTDEKLAEFSGMSPIVKIETNGENSFVVSRYLILDYGRAPDNLAVEFGAFISFGKYIQSLITQPENAIAESQ